MTDRDLADPANTSLGHRSVQRWNLPDGWVISAGPAHPALVSEAGFIAALDISAARGPSTGDDPVPPARRRYLLAGLLTCGICGRRMESAWSNGKPAYRCRHGHTTASKPDPDRPKNAYVREDRTADPPGPPQFCPVGLPGQAAATAAPDRRGRQARTRTRVEAGPPARAG